MGRKESRERAKGALSKESIAKSVPRELHDKMPWKALLLTTRQKTQNRERGGRESTVMKIIRLGEQAKKLNER